MNETKETKEIVYIHPKGYYAIVKRRGKGKLGGEYQFNETIYPPFPWQKNEPKPEPQPVRTVTVDHVTERDKVRFEKLYSQGYSIRKIAKITGWSDTAISNHLVKMGVIHEKAVTVTEREKAQFAKLYRQGYTAKKIAETSGWSKATVFRHLNLMGLIRQQKKLTDSEKAQIKSLARNGMTGAKIAEIVGVSRRTVYRQLHAIGIRRRQKT